MASRSPVLLGVHRAGGPVRGSLGTWLLRALVATVLFGGSGAGALPPRPVSPQPIAPKATSAQPIAPRAVSPQPIAPRAASSQPIVPRAVSPKPMVPRPGPVRPAMVRPVPQQPVPPLGLLRAPLRFTIEPYLQDVRPDGVVIAWSTDVPSTGAVRVDRAAGRSSVRATFNAEPGLHHRTRLVGLLPGQRYRYVVAISRLGDPAAVEVTSAPAEFSTAPSAPGAPFLFLVYGDNRDRDADHLAVIRAMLPEQPDLVVQTGDMVSRASDDGQWRRYFATAAPILRSVPMYPALGNHELRFDADAGHFLRYFVIPSVVPPLGHAAGSGAPDPEPAVRRRRPIYYAFRYSNALFVALDGNSPYDGEQSAWLERTLAEAQGDAAVQHLFAFVHQPPYAVGAYCGSERLQRRIVPLLARTARGSRPLLRAVFAGHEHAYQHLERGGVRYFITGGGGAPLYPRSQSCDPEDDLALRLFRAEHHYLRVQVDGEAATLLALSRSGEVIERVLLHEPVPKQPDDSSDERPGEHSPLLPLPATDTPTLGPETAGTGSAANDGARRGPRTTSGPILLLWVSGIATLAGLLLLTRPGGRHRSRRDLAPSARRRREGEDDEE